MGEVIEHPARRGKSRTVSGIFDNVGAKVWEWTHGDEVRAEAEAIGVPPPTGEWQNAVAEFNARVAELDEAERALWEVADKAQNDPTDAANWRAQNEKIIALKSTIESASRFLQLVVEGWRNMRSMVGLSGTSLGALPAVAPLTIGALVALTATIGAVVAGTWALVGSINQRYNAFTRVYEDGLKAGLSPEDAASAANKATEGMFFADKIADALKVALFVAGGVFGWWMIQKWGKR